MMKKVMVRVPPGDRWAAISSIKEVVAENLTAALASVARKYHVKEFTINAKDGEILIDDGQGSPTKDYVNSLYEEDI